MAAAPFSAPFWCFHHHLTLVLVFSQIPAAASPLLPFTSEAELALAPSILWSQSTGQRRGSLHLWALGLPAV